MYRKFHKLRVRFAELDLSQNEAARKAGISPGTMTNRMTGRQDFRAGEIIALAKVLNIPPEEYGAYFFENTRQSKKGA